MSREDSSARRLVGIFVRVGEDTLLAWGAWDWGVAPALGLPQIGPWQALAFVLFSEAVTGTRAMHGTVERLRVWITGEDLPKPMSEIPTARQDPPFRTLPVEEGSAAKPGPRGRTVN